jgi:hypothetical protein
VLSGFFLPLKFLISGKPVDVWSGIFRRYLRIIIPVAVIFSLYYLVARLNWTEDLKSVKQMNILKYLETVFISTAIGQDDAININTFCISTIFMCSLFVYLIAFTAYFYRWRFMIYLLAGTFTMIPTWVEYLGW